MGFLIDGAGAAASLLAIKEVRQAIGRLVSGMVDVPHSYFERWSEGVRNDTTARKAITSAVASAARSVAKEDRALVDRGLERWTRQLGVRQQAREHIGIRTLSVLAEAEVPDGVSAPSEEFMRIFEDMAEKVSSTEMVDLMARILAGEIRKPGSVSRRSLALIPVLDQDIVNALAKTKSYLLDGQWIHVAKSDRIMWQNNFALLSSVSITSETGARGLSESNGQSVIRIGNRALLLEVQPSFSGGVVFGGCSFDSNWSRIDVSTTVTERTYN